VTITGTNFDATQGTSTVTFNGISATATNWSPTSIVATVPSVATTGSVVVSVNGTASSGASFTVAPSVTNLSPTSGPVGTTVTITGTSFGSSQGSSSVTFNGTTATPTSWGAGSITVPVPAGATSGNVIVTISGVPSAGVPFTVFPTPNIASLSPNSGAVGTLVTITGTNFGATQGTSTVTFNGTTATPSNWSTGSIAVAVPTGATSGVVVVTANGVVSNGVNFTVQSGSFVATTGSMNSARYSATATQIASGTVLLTGGVGTSGVLNSAEIYNDSGQSFTSVGAMNVARWLHTATLLNNGQVLIAGGSDSLSQTTLNSAEIYDPVAGAFTLLTNTLNTARAGHTATLLNNGDVLIVGGFDPTTGIIADAEIYDSVNQVFIDLGPTNTPRYGHTATALQNGQVLIAGGETDLVPSGAYNTAEVFDPGEWVFTPTPGTMVSPREGHSAALLNNGQVLITGGDIPGTGSLNTAELYDPNSNTFTAVNSVMTTPRIFQLSNLLNGGKVLITGGATDSGGSTTPLGSAEFYDPTSQTFSTAGNMTSVREHQTATLLNDGTVLVAGGSNGSSILGTAELYMPSQLIGLSSIQIAPATPSISLGLQQLFVATGTFSNGSNEILASVLWSSSDAAVVGISNDATDTGFATTLSQGSGIISASAVGVSGSANVSVSAPNLVSITVTPQSAVIPLGGSQQFTATGLYTDGTTQDLTATATWTSSSNVVAVINSSGIAAGLFQGSTTIQAAFGNLTGSTSAIVGPPALVSTVLSPSSATIALGTSQQYQLTGNYTDGSTQNVTNAATWSASPSSAVNLSASGSATGLQQGAVTVTATIGTISSSGTLTIGAPSLVSVSLSPASPSINVDGSQQFAATGTYSDGSTNDVTASATWSSSSGNIGSISASGLATALQAGTTTITGQVNGINGATTLTVTGGTSLNTSRYLHAAELLNNGQILLAGGVNCPTVGSCNYLSSAELYDPSSGIFVATGSMSAARSAPAVLLPNGTMLIVGGSTCDSAGNCTSLNSAEIYDPGTGVFTVTGQMNVARDGHTLTLLSNGQVLVAGGETCSAGGGGGGGGLVLRRRMRSAAKAQAANLSPATDPSSVTCTPQASAELYDLNAGTFSFSNGSLSVSRFGAAAALLNSGNVLIAGGTDGSNVLSSAEIYNPTNDSFSTSSGNLNTARSALDATLLNNGQVLLTGGSTCYPLACPTNAGEVYDPAADTFINTTQSMNVSRLNQSATLLDNGQVLMAGGFSSCTSSSSCTSDGSTELYDPVASTFTLDHMMTTARAGHTGVPLPTGSVMLIGGMNGGITLSSAESYQPASTAPSGLISITVSAASTNLPSGGIQQLSALGTFGDGSTQNLQAVVWSSSNSGAATVNNASGSAGFVYGVAVGTTTITAAVGAISGSVQITVQPPNVVAVNPTSGSFGTQVTISGANFGAVQGAVTISGVQASVLSWTETSILASVPDQASPGPGQLVVTAGTTSSNSASFTVIPSIQSFSPSAAPIGASITIYGDNFGSNGTVTFDGLTATTTSWSSNAISVTVPTGASAGQVVVTSNSQPSNTAFFAIASTAIVSGISVNSGTAGTSVTITGSNFGSYQSAENGAVVINGANASVVSWNSSSIVAQVPNFASPGLGILSVTLGGVPSNTYSFTVIPTLNSSGSQSGGSGIFVTIAGADLGSNQNPGSIQFGGAQATVSNWNSTDLVVQVPDLPSGTVYVTVTTSGITTNSIPFVVSPTITTIAPAAATAGTSVTVSGGSFGTSGTVTFNGVSAIVSSWTDSTIVAQVPQSASSGEVVVTSAGIGSNGVPFNVIPPPPPSAAVSISPSNLSILAGTTQDFAVFDDSGNPVSGVTWSVDNPAVASFAAGTSALTANYPGQATVTATYQGVVGHTTVTVYAGQIPENTVLWTVPSFSNSNPTALLRATPTGTGADLFSIFTSDQFLDAPPDIVRGLTLNGEQLWTTSTNLALFGIGQTMPDNTGGLLIDDGTEMLRIDGNTGQQSWIYQNSNATRVSSIAVHPDGTIIRPEQSNQVPGGGFTQVTGLSGSSGTEKFQVSIPRGIYRTIQSCIGEDLTSELASPSGPIRIASNGTAYFEVMVVNSVETGTCTTDSLNETGQLLLYGIQSNGSVTTQLLSSSQLVAANGTYQVYNVVTPGGVIDDGQGGVLAFWYTYNSPTPPSATNSVMDVGGNGGEYTLPISENSVLLGENNKAYATDGSSIVQFDVNNGPEWTWTSPTYGIALVMATAGGGVVAENTTTPGQLSEGSGGNLYTLDSGGNLSITTVPYNSDYLGDGIWIANGFVTGPARQEGSAAGARPQGSEQHNGTTDPGLVLVATQDCHKNYKNVYGRYPIYSLRQPSNLQQEPACNQGNNQCFTVFEFIPEDPTNCVLQGGRYYGVNPCNYGDGSATSPYNEFDDEIVSFAESFNRTQYFDYGLLNQRLFGVKKIYRTLPGGSLQPKQPNYSWNKLHADAGSDPLIDGFLDPWLAPWDGKEESCNSSYSRYFH
jgi:hypothetical protein